MSPHIVLTSPSGVRYRFTDPSVFVRWVLQGRRFDAVRRSWTVRLVEPWRPGNWWEWP